MPDLKKFLNKVFSLFKEPQPTMGRWIEYPEAFSEDVVICSACDHVFNIFNNCVEEFKYCPHCGAWMER